ncbi:MAG: hypothetical protein RMA76_38285 [Deltaproteobacteria bacterium]|jgi:hypothetical protein
MREPLRDLFARPALSPPAPRWVRRVLDLLWLLHVCVGAVIVSVFVVATVVAALDAVGLTSPRGLFAVALAAVAGALGGRS